MNETKETNIVGIEKKKNYNNHLSSIAAEEETIIQKIFYSTAFWILFVILIMVIVFGVLTPNNVFFQLNTLLTIGLNASQMLILAVGTSYILYFSLRKY